MKVRKENQNSMTIELKENERIDELQRNGYKIIQDKDRFCFGMDAVLLSGFCKIKKGERVLDLGTGTGIIPILLEAKTEADHLTGLEIQEDSADMAKRSILLNQLEHKIDIICGDIKEASTIFGNGTFDVVTTNPPYMIGNHGLKNDDLPKTIARHELLCNFEDIVRETYKILVPGGRFYLVHRPFRLAEIMATLIQFGLEPKRMRLVYPYIDKEPNMVLIEAKKGGNSRITIEKPLIVYQDKNEYTEEIIQLYGF